MNTTPMLDICNMLIDILQLAATLSNTLLMPVLNWCGSGALSCLARGGMSPLLWISGALNIEA